MQIFSLCGIILNCMESNGSAPSQADRTDIIFEKGEDKMPNIKSAKKRVVTTEKRTLKNKMFRSEMKTTVKKFESAAATGDMSAAAAAYTDAVKKVDQASARGTIHKNAAARKKSQFAKKLNSLNK